MPTIDKTRSINNNVVLIKWVSFSLELGGKISRKKIDFSQIYHGR